MRTLPFFVLMCLACGGVVPSVSGYQTQLDGMVGHSINDAVRVLGAPTRTEDLAPGTKLYVWEEKSEMLTPLHGTETRDERGDEHIVLSGRERIPLDCETRMEVDAAGVVTHATSEGLACVTAASLVGLASPPAVAVPAPVAAVPAAAVPEPAIAAPLVTPPPAAEPAATEATVSTEAPAARGLGRGGGERRIRPRKGGKSTE